jgi:hypothetical protein
MTETQVGTRTRDAERCLVLINIGREAPVHALPPGLTITAALGAALPMQHGLTPSGVHRRKAPPRRFELRQTSQDVRGQRIAGLVHRGIGHRDDANACRHGRLHAEG